MLYLDTETFSETPIKNGGYRYTADAEIMIITYAYGDGDIKDVDLTRVDKIPNELEDGLLDEREIITAHNSNFDRNVLRQDLGYLSLIHI